MLHYLEIWLTDLSMEDARWMHPFWVCTTNSQVWWRRHHSMGLFFLVWIGPFSFCAGKAKGCWIWNNFALPTLWQEFSKGPFLFQHDNASVHKWHLYRIGLMTWKLKNWNGLLRAPVLNPLNMLGRVEMTTVNETTMPKICSRSVKYSSRRMEIISCVNIPKPSGQPFQNNIVEVIAAKGRPTSH